MNSNNKKGFTLIEILLVLAILSILAGIVIIAISPAKNLRQASTAARKADMNTVLNAVYQFSIDNGGALPAFATGMVVGTPYDICRSATGCTTGTVRNLGAEITPRYVSQIPVDPSLDVSCAPNDAGIVDGTYPNNYDHTCYTIKTLAGTPTRIEVCAPRNLNADTGASEPICVSR